MNRQELIDELVNDMNQVISEVKELAQLPMEQLSYQPTLDQWSVLQCIEHLNIADEHYVHHFEDKLTKANESSNENFKSGFFGQKFYKMIKPKADGTIPSPMKTFSKFRPPVDVKYDTIEKFFEDQGKIIEALEQARKIDLNKNRIPSAIGSIIMFKLGDAFRFLIGHNQRHLIQMKNVIAEAKEKLEPVNH